ncbi:helix-turn-helix domain-containing protein [Aureimonas endophytica]|nr:helix-turn-helix domain-containing protein [Aureimonas endophytica]
MDDEPWQQRAKRAGLTQKRLAALLGVAPNTVSRQLRGQFGSEVPRYVKTVIRAYEMLPQREREELSRLAESDEE